MQTLGRLDICTDSATTTAKSGRLTLDYTFEFIRPQIEPEGRVTIVPQQTGTTNMNLINGDFRTVPLENGNVQVQLPQGYAVLHTVVSQTGTIPNNPAYTHTAGITIEREEEGEGTLTAVTNGQRTIGDKVRF